MQQQIFQNIVLFDNGLSKLHNLIILWYNEYHITFYTDINNEIIVMILNIYKITMFYIKFEDFLIHNSKLI